MLSIHNISKQYAQHTALNKVSIEVKSGQIFGLLGPNGAGKTSLIRIINQITAPDKGEIYFNGQKLNQSHISQIGYLPEERGLYKKMDIGEQMIYLARLKGLSRADATSKIKYWFTKMEMEGWWKKKVEDLSKGMQQKVQFIAAVMHQPDLIILDEPFSGFDPVNAEIIKNEILTLQRNGSNIIISTHRMESVETLCQHIVILNKGHKILDGNIHHIRNSYRNGSFRIVLNKPLREISFNDFDIIGWVALNENYQFTIKLKNNATINQALMALIPLAQIIGIEEFIPSMNDIFIEKVNQNTPVYAKSVFNN
ncbi:MAG: ATP-binding cassette domain-containing protein [Sphingobacteriales bacterium]|nr:MAG: ATP-binding cassette domain-containing protein [Sphingobacteriales bacterium]